MYQDPVQVPDTFSYDYKHRAKAAKEVNVRVTDDLTYLDLGLAQPDGRVRVGEKVPIQGGFEQKVPAQSTAEELKAFKLIDKDDGTVFTVKSTAGLAEFKFQRIMQRYLRTIQSVDDSVG